MADISTITIPEGEFNFKDASAVASLSESNNQIVVTFRNGTSTAFDLPAAIPSSEKGVASGVATLDSNGKIPSSQLDTLSADVIEDYVDQITLQYRADALNSAQGTDMVNDIWGVVTSQAGE